MKNFRFVHFLERLECRQCDVGQFIKIKNLFRDTKNLFNSDLFIMKKKKSFYFYLCIANFIILFHYPYYFNRNHLNIIHECINIHIHIQSLISRLIFFYYFVRIKPI